MNVPIENQGSPANVPREKQDSPVVRLAATVMLVRPSATDSFEVYMLRRSGRSAFAPNAYVFPGGTLDPNEVALGEAGIAMAAVREVFEEAGLRLDARELRLFSHWITPPSEPRRYDTHFFLARAPQAQVALADARETHDGRWIVPRRALDEYHAGELRLVYPTIKHLERLAAFDDIEALFEFALTKPIVTIMPDVVAERGFTMPAELEHKW